MKISLNITQAALREIKHLIQNKNVPLNYGLRVGIKGGGGCGGVSYMLGFDHPKPTDEIQFYGDVQVLIEKKHVMFVIGLEIDFVDEAEERGFVFNAPQQV